MAVYRASVVEGWYFDITPSDDQGRWERSSVSSRTATCFPSFVAGSSFQFFTVPTAKSSKSDDERLRSRTSVTDPSGATTKETRTLRGLFTSAGGAGRGEAVAQLHRLPRGKSGSPASMFDLPLNMWRRQRSNGQRLFALSQQEV